MPPFSIWVGRLEGKGLPEPTPAEPQIKTRRRDELITFLATIRLVRKKAETP